MTHPRLRRDRVYPALLVGAALGAYLGFACPYVLGGDSGELLSLAARGGVAHPPGYPLLTLVLLALRPVASSAVALGAARVTGVLAAAAAGVLYAACRSFRASPEASLVAGALYASSPLAWLYATQVEVFALAALLAAALLALAGPASPLRGAQRLAGIALVMGLGLCHHHTIFALAPLGLLGGVRALAECERARWSRAALLSAFTFAVGLTPLGYMVWASRQASDAGGRWVWGEPLGLRGLLRHLARAEYWQQQAQDHRTPMPSLHFAALAASTARGLLWVGVPLALLGLARALLRRDGRGEGPGEAWSAAAFVGSALLAGPALLALLVGKPVGIYALVVERFHLLPQMLAAVPVAWGVDAALTRASPRAARAIAAAAVLAIAGVNGASVPRQLREAERPTVEEYLRNTLAELPSGAVLVGTGDHRCFGFFFLQTIAGVRPDVTYVEAGLLRDAWYRRRIARALGAAAGAVGESGPEVIRQLVAEGRAVFVSDSLEALLPPGHPSYALGTVVRVLPALASPPDPDALEAMNLALARTFAREPSPPNNPWSWSGEVDATYGRPFTDLARTFAALGQTDRARVDLERSAAHGRVQTLSQAGAP